MMETNIIQLSDALSEDIAASVNSKTIKTADDSRVGQIAVAAGLLTGAAAGMTAVQTAEVFCLLGIIGAGSPPLLAVGTAFWLASPIIGSAAGYAAKVGTEKLLNKII